MKRLVLILLTPVLLASCTSQIDKEIVIMEYSDVIKKIKENNTEYTEQDFKQASKEIDKYAFKALAQEKKVLDITYRQLLDEAKEVNSKKAKELEDYQKSLVPLDNALSMVMLEAKYVYDENVPIYNNIYVYGVNATNKTNDVIVAIKGKFHLYNDKGGGELIKEILFDKTGVLEPKEEIKIVDFSIIMEDDNLNELKVLPLDKIKVVWEPEEIIFKDGNRFTALQKPFDPDSI